MCGLQNGGVIMVSLVNALQKKEFSVSVSSSLCRVG